MPSDLTLTPLPVSASRPPWPMSRTTACPVCVTDWAPSAGALCPGCQTREDGIAAFRLAEEN